MTTKEKLIQVLKEALSRQLEPWEFGEYEKGPGIFKIEGDLDIAQLADSVLLTYGPVISVDAD